MRPSQRARAVASATSVAASLGLAVEGSTVLNDSNKLTLRLLPCDVVARVAPADIDTSSLEVAVARRLAWVGAPVVALDHRVPPLAHERDGSVITFWTHHEATAASGAPPGDYADVLRRLHAALRDVDVLAPRFTDRVQDAHRLLEEPTRTPRLGVADRQLLQRVLAWASTAVGQHGGEQLLHGEPHPGNLLLTRRGLLLIDWETCCRGPVEFDLAHAPDGVAERYPGVDLGVLRACRALVLAMVTTWRFDAADQLPDGHELGREWLGRLRAEHG